MNQFYKRLRTRIHSLSKKDLWLLIRMAGTLLALPLLQRLLTLPALIRLFDARSVPQPIAPAEVSRLIRLVQGLLNWRIGVFQPNCLKQSLVLFHFLRKQGCPARIHFGITKRHGKLAGHCWLTLLGKPLAEDGHPDAVFRTVYQFPAEVV